MEKLKTYFDYLFLQKEYSKDFTNPKLCFKVLKSIITKNITVYICQVHHLIFEGFLQN